IRSGTRRGRNGPSFPQIVALARIPRCTPTMSLRRKSREFALQMLFEWDMTRKDPKFVESIFWKSAPAADETRKFANQLFEGSVAQSEKNDGLVNRPAVNWRTEGRA